MEKKIKSEIDTQAQTMDTQAFVRYLIEMDVDNKIRIDYSAFDIVIDYARNRVNSMRNSLDDDEWYGCELAQLNVLEELPESEYDYIEIDAYGYPKSFQDNQQVISALVFK